MQSLRFNKCVREVSHYHWGLRKQILGMIEMPDMENGLFFNPLMIIRFAILGIDKTAAWNSLATHEDREKRVLSMIFGILFPT